MINMELLSLPRRQYTMDCVSLIKRIENVVLAMSGAGAASLACIDLVVSMGLRKENIYFCDRGGVIYKGRTQGMNEYKDRYAQETDRRTLDDALEGADIFFGLSGPGILSAENVKKMADRPIILAMANPIPEIMPEVARAARSDAIIATGRSDYPNQVNNVLCFPFIFRGALDSANIALGLPCSRSKGLLVGPFLSGTEKPVHILIPSVTARGSFNMSALASADIVRYRGETQSQ